ncbi:MAG: N-acetyl-gamma-glutamyl-phosphate reductase [Verrucomicrobiae bacterium]|nr:N-acetyl-gamma-glutamyl-phosphate reductase [Verrucomicrobiae bacterium]
MSTNPIKTAVVGASGYSGQELLRLLLMHPGVDLVAVTSRQEAGRPLGEVFPRFRGAAKIADLSFIDPDIDAIAATGAQCAFLALPHGVAYEYASGLLEKGIRVIDLSADFRLNDADIYAEFYGGNHPSPHLLKEAVYGLPEFYAEQIRQARLVASPGCYPTSILVPTLPLVSAGLIDPATIMVSSVSGASGAGKKVDAAYLFTEVNESVRAYGAPKHRHLSEIEQELSLAAGKAVRISFVPHLMPVNAGICTTIFCQPSGDTGSAGKSVADAYAEVYGNAPFVRILGENKFPDTKHVTGTNFVDVGWVEDKRTGRIILFSAEDNLGKGASSQAVQSFNLMFGLSETAGLLNF